MQPDLGATLKGSVVIVRSLAFGVAVTMVEMLLAFVLAAAQAFFMRGLVFPEAFGMAGDIAAVRLISLQPVLQVLLLAAVSYWEKEANLVLVLLSGVLAYFFGALLMTPMLHFKMAFAFHITFYVGDLVEAGPLVLFALAMPGAWLFVRWTLPPMTRS